MSNFYWHSPSWESQDVQGGATPGDNSNVGNDIVIELINTDFADIGDPRQDNFVVERVIGQYKVNAITGAAAGNRVIHHRVYVADGDKTSVSLRNLYAVDDADSSFLWHKVDHYSNFAIGLDWGGWAKGDSQEPSVPFHDGRQGSFDIRVGRSIPEGRSLLWHTQLKNGGIALDDDEWFLMLWVRVLMREK